MILKLGSGRFAAYAHLQPGSIRVRREQRLRTGQQIGRLGNSGNTDGPHLQFGIQTRPDPCPTACRSRSTPSPWREAPARPRHPGPSPSSARPAECVRRTRSSPRSRRSHPDWQPSGVREKRPPTGALAPAWPRASAPPVDQTPGPRPTRRSRTGRVRGQPGCRITPAPCSRKASAGRAKDRPGVSHTTAEVGRTLSNMSTEFVPRPCRGGAKN